MAFGDNGLIKQAQLAKDMAENSTMSEQEDMDNLSKEYANLIAEEEEGSLPDTRSEIEIARDEGTVFDKETTLTDKNENEVVIPDGFKIAEDSGGTVQEGIVIEDVSASTDTNVQGSQYVWIPVGNFIKDDGNAVNIVLGRYTFDQTDGTPTLEQDSANYTESVDLDFENDKYYELTEYREGEVGRNENEGENATAYNLAGFINSANTKGGYYIGRYEASYASGAKDETTIEDYTQCKAASKISKYYSSSSMSYVPGTLWETSQINASKVAINTYTGVNINSDLINSYAWDTAIVYIQEAGNDNYANTNITGDVTNTGSSGDEVCKINDMASNLNEWSTEYSDRTMGMVPMYYRYPCVYRGGGNIRPDSCAAYRYGMDSTVEYMGFRILIYM